MVDKVKPLKLENASLGGTQTDVYPTEADPTQDYLAGKGLALGNNDSFLIDKIGRWASGKMPDTWISPTYLANGEVDYIEYFNSSSLITVNRVLKVAFTYNSDLDVLTETWSVYDTDGTTVLRTITYTMTYSSNDPTLVTVAFT